MSSWLRIENTPSQDAAVGNWDFALELAVAVGEEQRTEVPFGH